MNEIMKMLTIIATIFIPLTFIVGIYGMNFDVMPELRWRYGYAAVMILMSLIAGGMMLYFWRKGWLGGQEPLANDHRQKEKEGGTLVYPPSLPPPTDE